MQGKSRQVKTMFKRLKNIRPALLISHIVITLGYPAVRAFNAPRNRLLVFTDAMTIVALILVILGILYAMVLHGDFDLSSYFLQRGVRNVSRRIFAKRGAAAEPDKSMSEFLNDAKETREESFNYPLFLGILYLLTAAVIAYGFLS